MTKRKPGSTTPPRVFWTNDQVAVLKSRYPNERAEAIAQSLGISVYRVYAKAKKLGLKKSAAFLASAESGRTGHDDRGVKHRFVKGQPCWSAGTSGVVGVHPNCVTTQFKKGRKAEEAHNYVPIGSEKVHLGYLIRKVTDDPTIVPARRWEFVHRLVWIEANGPIPDNHVVCFLPGRFSTERDKITVDALELVSRGELAKRNHPLSRDPELAKLVQLKGAITRQVNRIVREAEKKDDRE